MTFLEQLSSEVSPRVESLSIDQLRYVDPELARHEVQRRAQEERTPKQWAVEALESYIRYTEGESMLFIAHFVLDGIAKTFHEEALQVFSAEMGFDPFTLDTSPTVVDARNGTFLWGSVTHATTGIVQTATFQAMRDER